MCIGILGSLLGVVGSMITANEQEANAKRQAKARNDVLDSTLKANDQIAQGSEDQLKQRMGQITPAAATKDQATQTAARTATVAKAVSDPNANAGAIPLSGSAPDVVKSAVAQKLLDVFKQGKAHAQAAGKLGGFGDSWFNQGLKDADTQRQLSIGSNFTAGNLGILQPKQDIMEQRAYKPISPLGGILSGLGSMFGGGGGGGGGGYFG